MKLKKILAGILAAALVVTAVPTDFIVQADENITPKSGKINAQESDFVYLHQWEYNENNPDDDVNSGEMSQAAKDEYKRVAGTSDAYHLYDAPSFLVDNVLPYVALNIRADETREYTLTVSMNARKNAKITTFGVVIDGVTSVYNAPRNDNAASVNIPLILSRGDHTIIFTSVMPENQETALNVSSDWWNYYCTNSRYYSFTLPEGLTALKAPTKAEAEASLSGGTRIEAENTQYVSYDLMGKSGYGAESGDFEYSDYASGNKVVGGVSTKSITQTYDGLEDYLDKKSTPYVQYRVNAPKDGKYTIRLGALINRKNPTDGTRLPYCAVLVNDDGLYKAQFSGKWRSTEAINLTVDLKAGVNIIRCTSFTYDQKDIYDNNGWACINHDYLEVESALTALECGTKTTLQGEDTGIMSNGYDDKADNNTSLNGSSGNGVKVVKTSIETLEEDMKFVSSNWSYTAVNVTVPTGKTGFYDISFNMTTKSASTSTQIGMLVDGKAYGLPFNKSATTGNINEIVDATVFLTEGMHTIVFTTPIPMTKAQAITVANNDYNAYPWMNVDSITFDGGLIVESAPSIDNLLNSTGTRIEAEKSSFVTYNGYNPNNIDTNVKSASNYGVIGGVSKTDLKQKYNELESYLDKKSTAYVQYIVEAPTEGKYKIRVGFLAGTNGDKTKLTKPFSTVLVNDKAYKAQFDAEWDTVDTIELEVELKAGINIIRCTSLTTEQDSYSEDFSTWINQDFLDIENRLVAVSKVNDSLYSAASDYVVSNKFTDTDKTDTKLSNADCITLRSDSPTIEDLKVDLSKFDISRWPWTILKVTAPKDGYYDITVDMSYNTTVSEVSEQIAMIVDMGTSQQEIHSLPFSSSKIDASTYLTSGEHTIIFTTAMPKNQETLKTEKENNKTPDVNLYPWCDFNSFALGQELKAEAIGNATEILDTEKMIEAEDATYINVNGTNSKNVLLGASKGYILEGEVSDQTPLLKNKDNTEYLSWGKIPHIEYKVNTLSGGTYDITLKMKISGDETANTANPIVTTYVNGKCYEEEFIAGWNTFGEIKFTVDNLVSGINIIRTTVINEEQTATTVAYDYLKCSNNIQGFDGFVTEEVAMQSLPSTVAGNEEKVAFNKYDNDGSKLFDFTPPKEDAEDYEEKMEEAERNNYDLNNAFGDLRYDVLSIEGLAAYYEDNNLQRIPYVAINITAEADGYYDVEVKVGANANATSRQIGLLVDGKDMYSIRYNKASSPLVGASIYLEKGTHTLVFTSPMPETFEEVSDIVSGNGSTHPYFDFYLFTFSSGLTVENAPTNKEVENMFYDRIEAEDTDYVSYNGYKSDSLKTTKESSGSLVGGVFKNNLKQTYDNLKSYLDKKTTAYVQYTIEAKEAGTYKVRVGFLANTNASNPNEIAKPYSVVIVNDEVQGIAQYGERAWNNIDTDTLEVELKKGVNIIRVTSLTTEQDSYSEDFSTWINQDFLDIEKNDNLTVVKNGDIVKLEGKDGSIVSNNMKLASNGKSLATNGNTIGDLRWDRVSIEALAAKAGTLTSLDLTRMPWAAVRVTADHTGYYDISAAINTNDASTSKKIAMILMDEESTEVKALPFNVIEAENPKTINYNTIVDASMFLEKGKTYTMIFSTPIPEKEADLPETKTDVNAYPWMDLDSITLDEGLTVESLVADVTPTIEAEDSEHIIHSGAVKGFLKTSDGKVVETEATLDKTIKAGTIAGCLDLGSYDYVEHAVEASEEGNYKLTLNMLASAKDTYAVVVVNGAIYKAKASTDGFSDVQVEVALAKGVNVIRILSVTESDAEDTRLLYDYIDYAETLKAVAVEDLAADTTINAGDETKVLPNYYADKGDTLGDANYGDLRYDKLTLDVITVDNLPYIPYAGMKVKAEADGYYDISAMINPNTNAVADHIGLIVDGTSVYTLGFAQTKNSEAKATVYLTKGTHTLVFTSPMLETAAEFEAYAKENKLTTGNGSTHPYIDFVSFAFSKGLTVEKVPTVAEVENPFYTRIEAENIKYALYNGYTGESETHKGASEDTVTGGVKRWLLEQKFEDLGLWIDASNSHTAYIEYAIVAPEDGKYDIRVGYVADINKNVANRMEITKPFAAVLVNNNIYKAQYTADWGESQAIKLNVDLKKGLNIIRCTTYTADQEIFAVSSWINQDFIDLDKRLTALERSTTVVEAEDSKFYNLLSPQKGEEKEKASNGKVLGSAKVIRAKSIGLTLESFTPDQIRMIPYFSYTVEAPMDGYYSLSLNFCGDGRLAKSQIGVLVDDDVNTVRYNRSGSSSDMNKAIITVYLTKGEHNLTFTSPMPLNAEDMAKTDWSHRWMNFDYVTFHDGLKLSETQKSPTNIADLVRIEAENVGLPNLTKVVEAAEGKDVKEGYVGSAKYRRSQSAAEIKKNGIDARQTPFVQYTISASKAGTYTAYFSASYGIYKPTVDKLDATVAIEVNGQISFHTVHCEKNKTNSSLIPVEMKLNAGQNIVRLTHLTSDSIKGEGYAWLDYNYIEVPATTNDAITFLPTTGVVEAERADFENYASNASAGSSGGMALGSGDYKYIDEKDITFENLDVDKLGSIPRVTYTVEVAKAGTYDLSVQFNGGVINYTFNELVEKGCMGFAMAVNGGEKQLIEFAPDAGTGSISRIISVDLQQGENKIMFTTVLADYMSGVSPRIEDEYRLYWLDHDALRLSYGVSPLNGAGAAFDVNATDIDHDQLSPKATDVIDDVVEGNGIDIGIIIGAVALLLFILLMFLLLKKKKESEEAEVKRTKNNK